MHVRHGTKRSFRESKDEEKHAANAKRPKKKDQSNEFTRNSDKAAFENASGEDGARDGGDGYGSESDAETVNEAKAGPTSSRRSDLNKRLMDPDKWSFVNVRYRHGFLEYGMQKIGESRSNLKWKTMDMLIKLDKEITTKRAKSTTSIRPTWRKSAEMYYLPNASSGVPSTGSAAAGLRCHSYEKERSSANNRSIGGSTRKGRPMGTSKRVEVSLSKYRPQNGGYNRWMEENKRKVREGEELEELFATRPRTLETGSQGTIRQFAVKDEGTIVDCPGFQGPGFQGDSKRQTFNVSSLQDEIEEWSQCSPIRQSLNLQPRISLLNINSQSNYHEKHISFESKSMAAVVHSTISSLDREKCRWCQKTLILTIDKYSYRCRSGKCAGSMAINHVPSLEGVLSL